MQIIPLPFAKVIELRNPLDADTLLWVGGLEVSSWALMSGEVCLTRWTLVPSCWSNKISQLFFSYSRFFIFLPPPSFVHDFS